MNQRDFESRIADRAELAHKSEKRYHVIPNAEACPDQYDEMVLELTWTELAQEYDWATPEDLAALGALEVGQSHEVKLGGFGPKAAVEIERMS